MNWACPTARQKADADDLGIDVWISQLHLGAYWQHHHTTKPHDLTVALSVVHDGIVTQ